MTDKRSDEQNSIEALLKQVTDSPRQIWLAGLGAFAKVEQEGNRLFETLVKEGEALEARTRQTATEQMEAAKTQAQTQLEQAKNSASGAWSLLEKGMEEQKTRTLSRLGIPSHADFQLLSERVDALSASVHQLLAAEAARTAAAAKAAEDEQNESRH